MTPRQTLQALAALDRSHRQLAERRARALRGLVELPAREALVLAGLSGALGQPRSLGEIAAELGISKTRVVHLAARARERLELAASVKAKGLDGSDAARELAVARATLARMMILRNAGRAPSAKARSARNTSRQRVERRIAQLEAQLRRSAG